MNRSLADLETVLRQHNAGGFVDAVNGALKAKTDYVMLGVRAFYGEADVLYAALTYASLCGQAVLMVPEGDPADQQSGGSD